MSQSAYPIQFSVDYPDRPLDRLMTLLRPIVAVPILVVLGTVTGATWSWDSGNQSMIAGTGGLLLAGPLLMILYCQKYPKWWFDWNLELQRFGNRVVAYLALMDDRYPATDDQQAVHLEYGYPDVKRDLNRWMPLVKWFLAIPHYLILIVLNVAMVFAVIGAWFAILFTGRYPRGLFSFVEGVLRWNNRVIGYAIILVTDEYPPFSMDA